MILYDAAVWVRLYLHPQCGHIFVQDQIVQPVAARWQLSIQNLC